MKIALIILVLLLCPTVSLAAGSFTVAEAIEQHNENGPRVSYTAKLQTELHLERVGFFVEDTSELYVIESGFITPEKSGTANILIKTDTKDIRKLSKYIEDGRISKLEMLRLGFMYARTEKSSNAPSLFDVWGAM